MVAPRLARLLGIGPTMLAPMSVAGSMVGLVYDRVNALLTNVLVGVVHFTIVIFMIFYLLIDGSRLKQFVFELSPLPSDEEELIAEKFRDVGRALLIGNGVGLDLDAYRCGLCEGGYPEVGRAMIFYFWNRDEILEVA